jgi:uracil-DNA glycosylase
MLPVNILDEYTQLQNRYGEPTLDSIISGGQYTGPNVCFIFMNPTGRNVAANKSWKAIKSPWLGTKNIWKIFSELRMLDEEIYVEILKRKPMEWDYSFANRVYGNIEKRGIYITNLAKCTQVDARPLPNKVFKEYLDLLFKELDIVKPKKIVTFGNQVSSIFLDTNISVSKERKNIFMKNNIPTLPVYYPVGQGRRNMDLAVEDIEWFMNN